LLECIQGRIPRLAISTPPQHGKSTAVCIAASYALGLNQHEMLMYASYKEKFSTRGSRSVRRYIQSAPFVKRFGQFTISPDTAAEWMINAAGGNNRPSFIAVGGKSPGTGQSVTLSIVDDLLNGPDEGSSPVGLDNAWATLTQGLLTRLQPQGRMILIGTRWALDDPIGRLMKLSEDSVKAVPLVAVNFRMDGKINEWRSR
jgi:hypothetical protein